MTTEELLRPRSKVIAQYPFCPYPTGTLVPMSKIKSSFYDKYPHLFKKLEWWEERKVEDMPGFVKEKTAGYCVVCKIEKYETNKYGEIYGLTDATCTGKLFLKNANALPATEQEYNEYQSKQ